MFLENLLQKKIIIGSVRPNYTFALGSFALKMGPFAQIIKKIF